MTCSGAGRAREGYHVEYPSARCAVCSLRTAVVFSSASSSSNGRVFFSLPLAYAKAALGARQNMQGVVLTLSNRQTHALSSRPEMMGEDRDGQTPLLHDSYAR